MSIFSIARCGLVVGLLACATIITSEVKDIDLLRSTPASTFVSV